ncbi:hypothetical protein JHK82_022657 [Glycine max]|nr:hypothetical protein JHK86_022681 [Glycine max]KAG5137926.1 hypothetical protein JHK82_022657 [Glycine max]
MADRPMMPYYHGFEILTRDDVNAETSEDMLEWKITLEQALAQAPSVALVMGHNGIYPRSNGWMRAYVVQHAIKEVSQREPECHILIDSRIIYKGTLLNSKNQISSTTVNALREATSRGVKIVIATGKPSDHE